MLCSTSAYMGETDSVILSQKQSRFELLSVPGKFFRSHSHTHLTTGLLDISTNMDMETFVGVVFKYRVTVLDVVFGETGNGGIFHAVP